MVDQPTRRIWTVISLDRKALGNLGVARFDNADEAQSFAMAHRPCSIQEDLVPVDVAERWTFTRWVR
jgi:hypothetical protein